MRWSDRKDDDNLKALLRGEGGGRLGPALAELREKALDAPDALRERIRNLEEETASEKALRRPLLGRRLSFAHAGAAVAAVLVVAVAVPAIAAFTGSGGSSEAGDAASSPVVKWARSDEEAGETLAPVGPAIPGTADDLSAPPARLAAPPPAPPPPGTEVGGSAAAPLPPPRQRVQDYSAQIKLHVGDHDDLSESVQTAIRTTRNLGGYVTYVDYGTSGSKDGNAELRVRVPVGRVQAAIARFSELGTILEQQTEIRDLQGQIDSVTRDIQRRRDRIAKLEAELKDPTLTDAERDRLEARIVQAKRGLAKAMSLRTGIIRQGSFAKLDLAFTTEKGNEPAPPPGELRRTLDDAVGILAAELGVLLYIIIAGAPFIVLAGLAWLGARSLRRGANARVLERA